MLHEQARRYRQGLRRPHADFEFSMCPRVRKRDDLDTQVLGISPGHSLGQHTDTEAATDHHAQGVEAGDLDAQAERSLRQTGRPAQLDADGTAGVHADDVLVQCFDER